MDAQRRTALIFVTQSVGCASCMCDWGIRRKQIHRSRTGESTLKIIFHREIVMLFIESDTFRILRASRSFEWCLNLLKSNERFIRKP